MRPPDIVTEVSEIAATAPHAIILAAGAGSRFGGGKLVTPFEGRPLIAHVAMAVAEALADGLLSGAVAVIPPRATGLAWPLDTAGCTLVENPDPARGLASSLRLGLEAVGRAVPPAGAALIVLADQPRLRSATIARLVEMWHRTGRSVRPRYALAPEVPGHPVLLDRAAWPEAMRLDGDHGLAPLFRAFPELLTTVDVPGANPDVDAPEDLRALEDQH